ncbi:MAG: hypothetical protein DRN15_10035 [Thermoprotei archaeon]|nr:MAG: hypothetical protein DRN15_10035 [Thermoprotei archaeon]
MRSLRALLLVLILLVTTVTIAVVPAYMTEVKASPEVPPREQTLIVDIDGGRVADPTLWNPLVIGLRRDQGLHQLIFEQLAYINLETGEYIPWLMERFEYREGYRVLRVYLRKGVTWSDGKPFTADDVVFTYEIMLKFAPKLAYSETVATYVKEVRKIDDYTLEIVLKEPCPRFHMMQEAFPVCRLWGGMIIVPKHIFEKFKTAEEMLKFKFYPPVGTGPYKLVSASETRFIYERRDDWWGWKVFGVRPAPKYIIYVWYGPEELRAMRMAAHELDSICDIAPGTFLKLRERNPYVKAWRTGPPWAWIDPCPRYLKLTWKKYPWNIPEVRRALSYLIDREEIVRVAYENSTYPTWICLPYYGPILKYLCEEPTIEALLEGRYRPEVKKLLEKYEPHVYNPEKAYKIFEELGFKRGPDGFWYTPNGTKLELTLIVPAPWIEKRRIAAVLVPMLRKHGIDVVAKIVEEAVRVEIMMTGTFDAVLDWRCETVVDPYCNMEFWHSRYYRPIGEFAAKNHERYKNPEYDKIIDEWSMTSPEDFEKCYRLFIKALEIWLRDRPHGVMITQARKIVPFDTYYWIGWPDETNPWIHPCNWWQSFLLLIVGYPKPGTGEWVGGIRPRHVDYTTVYFVKDTPKFRGIDLRWYGPFKEGDTARIPTDDAEFLVKLGYASYKPPAVAPPTPPAVPGLEALASDVATIKESVAGLAEDVKAVKESVAALSGQLGALTAAVVIEAIVIIILAVVLFVVARRRS